MVSVGARVDKDHHHWPMYNNFITIFVVEVLRRHNLCILFLCKLFINYVNYESFN